MNAKEILKQLDLLFYYRKLDEVEPYLMSCIQKAMQAQDNAIILMCLNELMGFYRSQKRYQDSIQIATTALKFVDAIQDAKLTTYINVATCFSFADDLKTSLMYYKKAEALLDTTGDCHLKASLYNNISILYRKLGKYEDALKAIECAKSYADGQDAMLSCLNQIDIYMLLDDFSKAKALFESLDMSPYKHTRSYIDYLVLHYRLYHTQDNLKQLLDAILYFEGYSDRYLNYYQYLENDTSLYQPKPIQGLWMAENYYQVNAQESLANYDCMVAMFGEGSECLMLDDQISQDHDFGPGFLIIYKEPSIRKSLEKIYASLPSTWMGYRRNPSPHANQRVGVIHYKDYLRQTIGMDHLPETEEEWMQLKDESLVLLSNGKVFNGVDYFETIRQYYPENIYRLKLALCLIEIAKAGQYQYPRLLQRGDTFTAKRYLNKVLDEAIQLVFLINKQYMPYLKWQGAILKTLPLGQEIISAIFEENGLKCLKAIQNYFNEEDLEAYGWKIMHD